MNIIFSKEVSIFYPNNLGLIESLVVFTKSLLWFLPLETPRVNIEFFGQELQLSEPAEGRWVLQFPKKLDVHEDKGVSWGALSLGTFFERAKKVLNLR